MNYKREIVFLITQVNYKLKKIVCTSVGQSLPLIYSLQQILYHTIWNLKKQIW